MALIYRFAVLLALLVAAPVQARILPEAAPSEEATAASENAAETISVDSDAGQDERIASRLTDIFANVPSLNGVSAAVSGGVVTLSGTAPDQEAVDRAEAIASGVDGV